MDRYAHTAHSSPTASSLGTSSAGVRSAEFSGDASNAGLEGTTRQNPHPTSNNPTHHRDILSEAELGLTWLKRRAELVRLEIQAIELDLALQQARLGELSSLLAWLQKNGTPWQDYLPNPTTSAPIASSYNPAHSNPPHSNPAHTTAATTPVAVKPREPAAWRNPHGHQPAAPSPHSQPTLINDPAPETDHEKQLPSQTLETQTLETQAAGTQTHSQIPSASQTPPRVAAVTANSTATPPRTAQPTGTPPAARTPLPAPAHPQPAAHLQTEKPLAPIERPEKRSTPLAQPTAQTIKPLVGPPETLAKAKPSTRPASPASLKTHAKPSQTNNRARRSQGQQPKATFQSTATKIDAVQLPALETSQPAKNRHIPSWMISSLVHAALLLLLMLFTIPLPEQKQKLGLTGSFEPLESSPLTLEATTTHQANQLAEASATQKLTETTSLENVVQNSLPTAAEIAASSLTKPDVSSVLAQPGKPGLEGVENALGGPLVDNLKTTSSLAAANFFGLQADGNIFCFVVDCSGSMRGEPFQATKLELLKTISQLKPNQRFCVFFFSQKLFPMSLESPALESQPSESQPSESQPLAAAMVAEENMRPVAAYATPENFVRLQRWMETIPIGNGGPPNQALKMAIELEPDSIFLLTDGVTRSDVAGYLQKTNRQEDEFEGPQVRCPVHTIGFYSRDGEGLLQRIASENGGQYRYVPNPQPPKKTK